MVLRHADGDADRDNMTDSSASTYLLHTKSSSGMLYAPGALSSCVLAGWCLGPTPL